MSDRCAALQWSHEINGCNLLHLNMDNPSLKCNYFLFNIETIKLEYGGVKLFPKLFLDMDLTPIIGDDFFFF